LAIYYQHNTLQGYGVPELPGLAFHNSLIKLLKFHRIFYIFGTGGRIANFDFIAIRKAKIKK